MPVKAPPKLLKQRLQLTLTDEEVTQVEKLSSVLTTEQIAHFFGVSPRTFDNMLARDEDVREAYDRGRAKALAMVGGGLLKKALGGNLTAMIFYMKAQAGWRDQNQQVELTGKGGGPIETKDLTDDPIGAFTRRIAGIASRIGAVEVTEQPKRERRQLPSP